jgi:SPP1 family predicted phage head-tail adaptor
LTHSIFIRYTADILPTDRVNFKGRYMQIRAVVNMEERNRWIELACEEGVAQ